MSVWVGGLIPCTVLRQIVYEFFLRFVVSNDVDPKIVTASATIHVRNH